MSKEDLRMARLRYWALAKIPKIIVAQTSMNSELCSPETINIIRDCVLDHGFLDAWLG